MHYDVQIPTSLIKLLIGTLAKIFRNNIRDFMFSFMNNKDNLAEVCGICPGFSINEEHVMIFSNDVRVY